MNCLVENCTSDTMEYGYLGYCCKHYKRFKRYGDPGEPGSRRKPNGSGSLHLHGYIVYGAKGRPVHRMVMEQALGRNLFPHEVVHHKNGDRADNRLDNLELWSTDHPKGQKVDDLVEWAKEILERYA